MHAIGNKMLPSTQRGYFLEAYIQPLLTQLRWKTWREGQVKCASLAPASPARLTVTATYKEAEVHGCSATLKVQGLQVVEAEIKHESIL